MIGAGDVVDRFWLPTLAAHGGAEVMAIASSDGQRASEVAARAGILRSFAGHRDMLAAGGLDAVIVCTPPATHRAVCTDALAAGVHVLVEKPVCATLADWRALRCAAEASEAVLYYTFNNRLREENRWLAQRVRDERLGALELLDLEWLRAKPRGGAFWFADPAIAGGGVLADLGAHLVMIALGMVPTRSRFSVRCTATARPESPDGVDDVTAALLTIDGTLPVTLRLGWGMGLARPVEANFRAFCQRGSLTNHDYDGPSSDGYGAVLEVFLRVIREGRQPTLGLLDDVMTVIDALRRSGAEGREISGLLEGGIDSDAAALDR